MTTLDLRRHAALLTWLSLFHLLVITSSNYLVQLPVSIFGLHTTWGAFSFPFIFLATDLTVRFFGAPLARRIIFAVMLPATFYVNGMQLADTIVASLHDSRFELDKVGGVAVPTRASLPYQFGGGGGRGGRGQVPDKKDEGGSSIPGIQEVSDQPGVELPKVIFTATTK